MTMVSITGSPRPGRRNGPIFTRLSLKILLVCLFCCFVAWIALGLSVLSSSVDKDESGRNAASAQHQAVIDVSPSTTIAYAVSITGCGSESLVDAAAVLKHSIDLSSVSGRYKPKMYAIVHPEAMSCAAPLADVGYTLLIRDTPIAVEEIQGEFLRKRIVTNGCCGEKELIKFEAYTLTEHPLVVHLDLDTLVLKSLEDIFDLMLGTGSPDRVEIMWKDQPVPERIDATFTRDYNMVPASRKYKPVQGGFLVLRPSMTTYDTIVDIVRKGEFIQGKGWGGVMGLFYGSQTFQGLVPYYYDVVDPGHAVELNRCIYNNMCDNPRDQRTVNDVVNGKCRDGRDDCEDCRSQPVKDIVTTHFTVCQKPWFCLPHTEDMIQHRLCRKLHHEWFRIRSSLEESWGQSARGPGGYQSDQFLGFCNKRGQHGYLKIVHPKVKEERQLDN